MPPLTRFPSLALLAIVVLAAASLASADDGDRATEVVARHLEAMGGLERVDAIRTLRMTGAFEISGTEAAFIQERSRPNRVRFEYATPGEAPRMLATDGEVAWQADSALAGDVDVLPPEQAERYGRQTSIDGPLIAAWRARRPIRYVARESLDGREVDHLRVSWPNGEHADLYLDADDHLIRRMDDHWRIAGHTAVIELHYADYRRVDGVPVAFEIEQRTTQGSWRWHATTAEPNVTIADARFRPPRLDPPPADGR